jgi:hypothetical protein
LERLTEERDTRESLKNGFGGITAVPVKNKKRDIRKPNGGGRCEGYEESPIGGFNWIKKEFSSSNPPHVNYLLVIRS